MSPLLLWWKFGWLKKALSAGNGAVFDAHSLGNHPSLAIGHLVSLRDSRYSTEAAGRGLAAWALIENNPEAVNAVLTCPQCHFSHVIRSHFCNGMERLTSCGFGRFSDRYQGQWRSSWFKLAAPLVKEFGIKDELACQNCKAVEIPRIRIY